MGGTEWRKATRNRDEQSGRLGFPKGTVSSQRAKEAASQSNCPPAHGEGKPAVTWAQHPVRKPRLPKTRRHLRSRRRGSLGPASRRTRAVAGSAQPAQRGQRPRPDRALPGEGKLTGYLIIPRGAGDELLIRTENPGNKRKKMMVCSKKTHKVVRDTATGMDWRRVFSRDSRNTEH